MGDFAYSSELMANHIADTVGSLKRRGDYVSLTVERLPGDSDLVRFRCSCGEVGSWFDRREVRFALAMVCLRWSSHVEVDHDD